MLENRYNYNTQTGAYRERILIRRRILTQDALLQEVETFEDLGYFWSRIITTRGQEYFAASQEGQQNVTRFIFKYAKALDMLIYEQHTHFELVYKNRTYDVKTAYNDNERDNTITIIAEARV